jgi:hypothetical protein
MTRAYTVRKRGGNNDREFQAYIDLLEEIGIDIANVPRTAEKGTTNRWLYVWHNRTQAERFAREIGKRLRQDDWVVEDVEISGDEDLGALAPLIVLAIDTPGWRTYLLDSRSQARIMRHYPNARLFSGEIPFPSKLIHDYPEIQTALGNQVVQKLTGLSDEAIDRLGGARIVLFNESANTRDAFDQTLYDSRSHSQPLGQ